ncbi:MAG: replication initiation protein [Parvimonas sp.]|uniref:replication initiation protein n=1 Tax=Parvimonas sp. TaxID=1944660 RepID=UPI002A756357|nr:replication initiation protein [Parvimonas sp.]MDY3050824.1 replication initiation protein [Parvimonas sp.]
MANIVKYKNRFNSLPLKDFNPSELNLLMALIERMKNLENKEILLTFSEIRDICNYTSNSNEKLAEDLYSTNKKLMRLDFVIEDEKTIKMFVLFPTFTINKSTQELKIAVNSDFMYVLNNFLGLFTEFELEEFISLKSGYAKECYRRLKQFKNTGYYTVFMEDFRKLMDIPDSYKMSEIDKRVLKPILKELSPIFPGLKIEKIKKTGRFTGGGRPVHKLNFLFNFDENNYFKTEDEAILYAYKTNKNAKFEILFDKTKGYFAKFS